MSKYTPGQWRAGKGHVVSDSDPSEGRSTGHADAEFYGGYLIAESIFRSADAALIAAAPDLLEALEKIADSEPFHDGMDPVAYVRWVANTAAPAIAKAKGES